MMHRDADIQTLKAELHRLQSVVDHLMEYKRKAEDEPAVEYEDSHVQPITNVPKCSVGGHQEYLCRSIDCIPF